MRKPILCLDFDGVIHSYSSGWKGADIIPDPPVDGAFEFIEAASELFEIHIFSSRSHQEGGIDAMREWMALWAGTLNGDHPPEWFLNLKFPTEKPPAHVSIDDRGFRFEGWWPSLASLLAFRPWNKRDA